MLDPFGFRQIQVVDYSRALAMDGHKLTASSGRFERLWLMPQIDQVRMIAFKNEEIGMGFNSATGLAVGTPLQDFTITENPAAPGQHADASITIVTTHEEVMDKLGLSFEAEGRYGFYSGGAKVSLVLSRRLSGSPCRQQRMVP